MLWLTYIGQHIDKRESLSLPTRCVRSTSFSYLVNHLVIMLIKPTGSQQVFQRADSTLMATIRPNINMLWNRILNILLLRQGALRTLVCWSTLKFLLDLGLQGFAQDCSKFLHRVLRLFCFLLQLYYLRNQKQFMSNHK